MSRKLRFMMIGMGDVAQRLALSEPARRARWFGLTRSDEARTRARASSVLSVSGDLDSRISLLRAANIARSSAATIFLAPPPNIGGDDPRVKRWIAARSRALTRPLRGERRFEALRRASRAHSGRRGKSTLTDIYVSTTGVYGDRAGERVSEVSVLRAQSARAARRVAAERRVRNSAQTRMAVLRVPGIYAQTRLPIERLRERLPALVAAEDVYTNHIHADDLAHAIWLSVFRARAGRTYNIVDDAEWKMGDYFDRVADALGFVRPPRMSRGELARHITPMMLSFMSESRRIENTRMKRELRLVMRYPTPDTLLQSMNPTDALQRSLDV
ncbi:MAG: SDR family NAD(P)-dependent oxidoreductase [Betaproteobacteria bacterium]|nr:MAG: SDR family NAD(P)-dependent oxidoreductase [Betaproteobacteria bacterium]